MYLNVLILTVIVVIILDVTDFVPEITSRIRSWFTGGRMKSPIYAKPWTCSLCMSHHINVIYALIVGKFTLPLWLFIIALSITTPFIKDVILVVEDALVASVDYIRNKLKIN